MKFQLALLVLAGLVAAAPAAGQEVCTKAQQDFINWIIQARRDELRADKLVAAPLTRPPTSQATAPADGSTDDTVPDASFPSLIAFALGAQTSQSAGAMTLNLTPFALVAARTPGVLSSQSLYERSEYASLRKIGLAVTLGGKGEAFDRDGDGDIDEALMAEKSGDSISAELRYRFFGSRDRRDPRNYRLVESRLNDVLSAADKKKNEALSGPLENELLQLVRANKLCPSEVPRVISRNGAQVDKLIGLVDTIEATRKEILEEVDSQPVWTFVAGGLDRKAELGPNRWWLGVRGSGGLGPDQGWNVSLDYGETNLAAFPDARRIKFGLEYSALFGRRLARSGTNGMRGSLSASYESWKNVPGTDNDTVAYITMKVAYPLTDTVSVPVSITWANKTDLLKDEADVRGYIGFTYDIDGLIPKLINSM